MVGVRFARTSFRLSSVEGLIAEMLVELGESEKALGRGFFDTVFQGAATRNNGIVLSSSDQLNHLTINKSDIIFRKTATKDQTVRPSKALEQFNIMLSAILKILKTKGFRRIGLVLEYREEEKTKGSASNQFRNSLLSFPVSNDSSNFHLKYEDREIPTELENHNPQADAFENTIYSYYLSEQDDQTKEEGKLCFSLDFQRYFNPTIHPRGIKKELDQAKLVLADKKRKFFEDMNNKGFLLGE